MIRFYHAHKFTPLTNSETISEKEFYNTNFFQKFFTWEYVLLLKNSHLPKEKYQTIKKISQSFNAETFIVDSFVLDSLPVLLQNPLSILLFIYFIRHSDKDFYIGTVENISSALGQNSVNIITALSELEEYCLVTIEGKSLLKITLNRNWNSTCFS